MKLTGRDLSQLAMLERRPGLWWKVEPSRAVDDLWRLIATGLIRHLGEGKGYEITDAGKAALRGGKTE